MKNFYDISELILRMYTKGVCANALSDWLGIPKNELQRMLESSGELKDKPTMVKVIEKSSQRLSQESHRCKYCGKSGKMYHIHSSYRCLCIDCLADKLNYGDKKYERYAWTTMSIEEIYAAFTDCYVGGFTSYSSNWNEHVTVDYIGTLEGATEWYNWQDQCCTVVPGRFPRRSSNIVENGNINIEQLVGVWHNRPVETKKKADETMAIYSDGTGLYTDYNGRVLKMDWYIQGDIWNITMDDKFTFYRGPFYVRETDIVEDVFGILHSYPSWGWTEYDSARHAIRGKYYKVT